MSSTSDDPFGYLANVLSNSTSSAISQSWLDEMESQVGHWNIPPGEVVPVPTAQPMDEGSWKFPQVPVVKGEPQELVPEQRASATPQSAVMQAYLAQTAVDLRESRREIRARADRVFSASLTLGVLGGIALFAGIAIALAGLAPIGITVSAGGVLSGIFSGIFGHLYRTENGDVKTLVQDLRVIEETRLGLWLAEHITDAGKRDEVIVALADELGRS